MNILYFSWNEIIKENALQAIEHCGHIVKALNMNVIRYDYDDTIISAVKTELKRGKYDIIFSFNYFPDLSRVANETGILYVSWVYDSPHNTLESVTVNNSCNHIFVFDRKLVNKYNRIGIKTINYLPLPARIYKPANAGYINDIAFVGSLYTGSRDQYGKIGYLPDSLRGRLDGIMQAQHQLYGLNIVDELIERDTLCEIKKYVNCEIGASYRDYSSEFIKDIIKKHITMIDRVKGLSMIGTMIHEKVLPADALVVYTESASDKLPFVNKGIINYHNDMPEVFARTKINLNLTLRSITSGIPLRVMDIMGAGGFCLSNFQEEYTEYFENGKELVWFSDWDEMIFNISYYLEHEDERKEIAISGQKKMAEMFSYEILFGQIFSKVKSSI